MSFKSPSRSFSSSSLSGSRGSRGSLFGGISPAAIGNLANTTSVVQINSSTLAQLMIKRPWRVWMTVWGISVKSSTPGGIQQSTGGANQRGSDEERSWERQRLERLWEDRYGSEKPGEQIQGFVKNSCMLFYYKVHNQMFGHTCSFYNYFLILE